MTEEEQELVEVMAGAVEDERKAHGEPRWGWNFEIARAALQAAKAAGYTITRSARHGIRHEREGFEGEPTP